MVCEAIFFHSPVGSSVQFSNRLRTNFADSVYFQYVQEGGLPIFSATPAVGVSESSQSGASAKAQQAKSARSFRDFEVTNTRQSRGASPVVPEQQQEQDVDNDERPVMRMKRDTLKGDPKCNYAGNFETVVNVTVGPPLPLSSFSLMWLRYISSTDEFKSGSSLGGGGGRGGGDRERARRKVALTPFSRPTPYFHTRASRF